MCYIHFDENTKPTREMQHRLNPNMKEVIRAELWNYWSQVSFTPYLIVNGSVICKLSPKSQELQ